MNSKVHPLIVILVIALTLFAIGTWVWGTGEAKKIGGPAELRTDPDGHLYIQIQNQLLEHDTDGVFVKRHDLADLGIDTILGGIAFFSDGDILLRRGPDPRTVLDNVRAFQRRTNRTTLTPESPDSGLYRCDLELMTCVLFGSEGIDFKAAHSIFIDWLNDDVYITDTTRHLLRKYSASGEAVTNPVSGFRFPNQLLMHERQLLVVDTNHHEIRIVDPRTEHFGEELNTIDVVPSVASAAEQTWPSHIARVGSEWWVNNMRTGMNEGGIYVFDDNGHFTQKISLPAGADPISLISFQGVVLISDWNNDRIYSVSHDGEVYKDFASVGLDQVLAESRTARRYFNMVGFSGIALFAFVLGGLLVRALAVKMSNGPKSGNTSTT